MAGPISEPNAAPLTEAVNKDGLLKNFAREVVNRVMATTFTALFLLISFPSGAEEPYPEELCNVIIIIESLYGKDGPLNRCRIGDTVHFQINKTLVSPASVAARYCDFNFQILTDTLPNSPTAHLVCKYKWKWAKDVEMKKHPDAR